jgi:beta-phosphoglucomutase family hydrolase
MKVESMRDVFKKAISRDRYDAVLFDLDGVIVDTVTLHAASWKEILDEYLQRRATERREEFRPFDAAMDYWRYVDGKPRFDGVRDFLVSRNIQLPEGHVDDSADVETIAGLSNRKNDLVNSIIEVRPVHPYEGTVRLIHQLRHDGFKLAVVTSSENCSGLLKSTNLEAFFDAQVDGTLVKARNLSGKPAPDTFLLAAQLLGVLPARAVVVEDAIAGVQAGSTGKFGLVIGVARTTSPEELRRHGAHVVVNDLAEIVDHERPPLFFEE